MRTLYEDKLCHVLLVDGHVAVVGQSKVVGTRKIAGRLIRMASAYDYLRFRDAGTGKDVVVRSVTTYDNCDAYLAAGTRGRFVIFDVRDKSAGPGTILAVATDGQVLDDVDHLVEGLEAGVTFARRICWGMLALGVPSLVFPPAGLALLGFGIWGLVKVGRIRRLTAQMPDRSVLLSLVAATRDDADPPVVPMET